jgi:hypothetical protein
VKKLLLLVVVIILAIGGFTMWQYSQDIQRPPWAWSGEDWTNWVTFTKSESQSATRGIGEQARETGTEAWKWVGKNTQILFEKSKTLLDQLGPSLDMQSASSEGSTETTSSAAARPETPPDPLDAQSPNYKYGKEWLRKGIAEWKVSLIHPGAAERAKAHFEQAISSFKAARQELTDSSVVDAWVKSAQDYLADIKERLMLIHQAQG